MPGRLNGEILVVFHNRDKGLQTIYAFAVLGWNADRGMMHGIELFEVPHG